MELDKISMDRLAAVHPDLRLVMINAAHICPYPFRVTCGVRSAVEQMEAFKHGASKFDGIPKSKGGHGVSEHQLGMAADIVGMNNGVPDWSANKFKLLNEYIQQAAKTSQIPIIWGGNWTHFVDMPHYQLDRSVYKTPLINYAK